MPLKIGYLLPTRERVMEGAPAARPLIDLAARAADLGYDSIWVGDSLTARPRHEPLALLAGVAGRLPGMTVGTAVLLPALRNPVLLAHQVATLDQVSAGRLILGVGIAGDVPSIRAEFLAAGVPFEKRVGRMLEGLRLARALWRGEPVTWEGRWRLEDAVLGPVPHRPGGPPIWIGSHVPAGLARAGRHFDGWFPTGPDAERFAAGWRDVQQAATEAGREPGAVSAAVYLTLAVDDDAARAEVRIDRYLADYYRQPAEVMRRRQANYAGPASGAAAWIRGFVDAGATHVVLRFAGDHERHLETLARVRDEIGV